MIERTERLLQWNLQGMTTSKEDLLKIINDIEPIAVAVQETFYGGDFIANIKGYNGICKQGHFNRRFHGGVALYIHSSVPSQELIIQSDLQIVAAKIHIGKFKTVTIASVYIPPRSELNTDQLSNIFKDLPKPLIVMGDLNAHHTDWGNNTTNLRGRQIKDLCETNNLSIINDGSGTHISGSAIDLTLVTPDLIPDINFNTMPSVLSSDHHPIILTLTLQQGDGHQIIEGWNFRKGNWKGFHEDAVWNQIHEETFPQDTRAAIEQLYLCYKQTADKYIPKYKARRHFPKPWWNPVCRAAWLEREKQYRIFKRTGEVEDKIVWKRARAQANKTFREAKEKHWREYVSALSVGTPSSLVWEQLGRIRGRPKRKISILRMGDEYFSSVGDIAEAIAKTFEEISSDTNYPQQFLDHKHQAEQTPINLDSDNSEPYNQPFTIHELNSAIRSNKITAPGPDEISNLMIKNMPTIAHEYLLKLFNAMWMNEYVHQPWKKATIVPIPKPGKDHTDPKNYRPISLTSCLCKTYEKMINRRLATYLENNKIFAAIQCGFRRFKATIDHLIRFDTYIRKAFAGKEEIIAVFFDLEKAYDMAWRYGIIRDLAAAGLRGRLPKFIQEFLNDRTFQVKIDNQYSSIRNLMSGTPQGSTLSVTLFAIKINSLAKVIPTDVFASMFVDDLLIAFSHQNRDVVQKKLQLTVDRVAQWAKTEGFKFSVKKTNMMQFFESSKPTICPTLKMEENQIPIVKSAKFLGLHWDQQLKWNVHIRQLKSRCLRDLNLLKTITSTSWGADKEISMRLYRAVIRPKLDYGCVVYGSASTALLKELEVIANEAMRISSGAFKSSPIKCLNILCNEPELSLRRMDLTLRYYFKTKCHLQNPAYSCIVNDPLELFFNSRLKSGSVIQKVRNAINLYNIPIQPVMPYRTPKIFYWTMTRPAIEINLSSLKREDMQHMTHNMIRQLHRENQTNYDGYKIIYTDGSKTEGGVGAAAVMEETVRRLSLPVVATVMTAELYAIKLALDIVNETNHNKFVICSDSMSSIQSIDSYADNNQLLFRIMTTIHEISLTSKEITFSWVPSHVGIRENDRADEAAREASTRPPEFTHIPYQDWYPIIKKRTYDLWREQWRQQRNNLVQMKPQPGRWKTHKLTRAEEVVINRIRIGHTRITHRYLMDEDEMGQRPVCGWCDQAILTIQHILIECPALTDVRTRYLVPYVKRELNMESLLCDGGPCDHVLTYLKEINVFQFI